MSERIGTILRRSRIAERLYPPEVLAAIKAAGLAIDDQGNVKPRAVSQAVRQVTSLDIAGTVTTSSAPIPRRVPAASTKVRLDAYALTPPSGGPFTATVYADGEAIGTVTIADSASSGGEASIAPLPAGAWLTADVTAANSAANVTIAVTFRVAG